MGHQKREIRRRFREGVLERDGHACRACGVPEAELLARDPAERLDAHHITDRNRMEAGGYVVENGVSL